MRAEGRWDLISLPRIDTIPLITVNSQIPYLKANSIFIKNTLLTIDSHTQNGKLRVDPADVGLHCFQKRINQAEHIVHVYLFACENLV